MELHLRVSGQSAAAEQGTLRQAKVGDERGHTWTAKAWWQQVQVTRCHAASAGSKAASGQPVTVRGR